MADGYNRPLGQHVEEVLMAVLVSGAAGFVAFHLCQRLLRDGEEVIGVDNFASGQPDHAAVLRGHPKFRWMEADVARAFSVSGPVTKVFNLACPASPVDFEPLSIEILRTCSEGVLNLLHLARQKEATFLQTSTSECYGDPLVHPQVETYYGNVNPIGLRSPYDEGKRFAEALITAFHRRHGLPVRIARVFNTYGPGMRPNDGRVISNFIMQALANKPLTLHNEGKQTRSFCYVDDLVEGLIRLSRADYTQPVNLGNPDEVTIRQVAEEIVELIGSTSKLESVPARADDPAVRCPDITRARALLGWSPQVPRREGLKRTIDDFRIGRRAGL
jgi:dTDP-glucose 4,6-dehydratase